MGLLAEIADAAGIVTFEAEVLPENGPMLEVFRESGLPVQIRSEHESSDIDSDVVAWLREAYEQAG